MKKLNEIHVMKDPNVEGMLLVMDKNGNVLDHYSPKPGEDVERALMLSFVRENPGLALEMSDFEIIFDD